MCAKCKDKEEKTPATGRKATLNGRNWKTWLLFHEFRGSGGVVQDEMTRKMFGIIELTMTSYERSQRQGMIQLLGAKP